jgi:phage terminase large subunit-like protein
MSKNKTDIASIKQTEAYKFAKECTEKSSTQCEYIKLCADRFLRDLKRDDLFFDVDAYERIIRYYRIFRHTKGFLKGERFDLRNDQKFFIGQIIAWKNRSDNSQRITETYKEVARKNGKSWEAGGLAGYHLTSAGEGEAEVYSLATSVRQASESWKAFKSMSKTNSKYAKTLEYRIGAVRHPKSASVFEPLASVGENLDGKNPSFILIDEYHLFRKIDDESRNSLRGGAVARNNRLEFKITTGGSNTFGSCFEERKRAIDVLKGTIELDFYLPIIFTLDDGDDWTDERVWHKANPALNISKSLSAMREEFRLAQHSPRLVNVFKQKQLDLWTNEAKAWLSVDDWRNLAKPIPAEELRGKHCIIGVDLSETNDLTAITFLFPPQDSLRNYYARTIFFCPSVPAVIRQTNKVPYLTWQAQGFIRYSGEKRIDFKKVADEVMHEIKQGGYAVDCIAFDAWKSNVLIEEFKKNGLNTQPIKQYYQQLSPACRMLEELIDKGEITNDGNECMTWNIGNVVLDTDPNGNVKPNKQKSSEKIDGVASLIDALAYLNLENKTSNIITECPIRLL